MPRVSARDGALDGAIDGALDTALAAAVGALEGARDIALSALLASSNFLTESLNSCFAVFSMYRLPYGSANFRGAGGCPRWERSDGPGGGPFGVVDSNGVLAPLNLSSNYVP
jgi:hypothetical protein